MSEREKNKKKNNAYKTQKTKYLAKLTTLKNQGCTHVLQKMY
jgi:hypothetical protein